VGVFDGVAHVAAGNEMILPAPPDDVSDPLAVWVEGRDRVLEALDQEGALDHEGKYWFGPMTIDQLIGVVQWDPLAHAWDVSQATGVEAVLDEELARLSYERISAMRESLAKMRLIGDEVAVAADASYIDRFLGLIGRDPGR
jgi:uncharacterized protein (TIGR03086 family)